MTPPAFFRRRIISILQDSRDEPILLFFTNLIPFLLFGVAFVFWHGSHIAGAIFFTANLCLFYERFILSLHFSSHRPLTHNPYLNKLPEYLLAPFFGIPAGFYKLHHVIMHHSENNFFPGDLSSTEPYQRDNPLHFLMYWAHFLVLVWIELPLYAFRTRSIGFTASLLLRCALNIILFVYLFLYKPIPTLWVFLMPLVVGSILLMFGNWSQHIFIDSSEPDNNYKLTYNIINTKANTRTFNDGFHIEHHKSGGRHWSLLPESFLASCHEYEKNDAIVFCSVDFITIGVWVFLGKYSKITQHLVQFPNNARSPDEVETFLRSRLRPVQRRSMQKIQD